MTQTIRKAVVGLQARKILRQLWKNYLPEMFRILHDPGRIKNIEVSLHG